jgi:hypothetical protein
MASVETISGMGGIVDSGVRGEFRYDIFDTL